MCGFFFSLSVCLYVMDKDEIEEETRQLYSLIQISYLTIITYVMYTNCRTLGGFSAVEEKTYEGGEE